MEEMSKHGKIGRAAMKADMDRKTARKYVQAGTLPPLEERIPLEPRVIPGSVVPQSNRGRTRIRTRGQPSSGRMRRMIICGRKLRPRASKRGQKSVISTDPLTTISLLSVFRTPSVADSRTSCPESIKKVTTSSSSREAEMFATAGPDNTGWVQ